MIKKIIISFNRYISLGANEKTSNSDLKKIQLLHIFCNTWHLFTLLSFIEDFTKKRLLIYSYVMMFILVLSVQILIYFKKITIAGVLFVFNLFFVTIVFSNYVYVAELLEFYLILVPIIAIIFINNRIINIAILVLALLCFFIPNLYFKHYSLSILNNINPPFLFFSVFIVVSYFKNLNIRNEKILEAKTKELEDLDKFKSQFFTNISHEIRTPLTLINGYISDLNTDDLNRKEVENNIKKQIYKITDLVDSVLDLAKMQTSNFSLQTKETNVSELLRKLYLNFEPLFHQKKIIFNISNNNVDYFANIDVLFFEKALNNLIINALKYTDVGKVALNISQQNKKILIQVIDTGIGIFESETAFVFNRFYQVNNDINKAGGSGIGLAFCKEIIELHQGSISLKSQPKIGSEFTISLPLIKSVPVVLSVNKSNIKKEIAKTKKNSPLLNSNFLIVDDNYDMRKYLITILENYHCFEAQNGLEALELINNTKIDFIITDYMMPKLNGYELIKKLNEKNNTIPIIMLTAKTNIRTKLTVLKLGIDDYITKPFNKNELLTRINNCLKNNNEKKAYVKQYKITNNAINYQDPLVEQLCLYIFENSNNTSLNQDIIAEEFSISKSSFYRRIKSSTGLSPNNFIREIRLQKARNILDETPNITLKQLSYEVGFNNANYFSKVYKNRYGVKPLKIKSK